MAWRSDDASITRLLTAAFFDDPIMGWLFPDRVTRPTALEAVLRGYLRGGEVRTPGSDGILRAVAVWFDPGRDEPASDVLPPVLAPHLDRLAELDRLLAERHPTGVDHRQLRVIGVRPEDRGHGHGGSLLSRGLAEWDAAGLPVYLEASTQRNAALYARHGFLPYGPPIRLSGGPALYPMWRDPAPMIINRTEHQS